MDSDEFRIQGKQMVDFIVDYLENIRERRVFPDVKPGFLREQLPEHAPLEGEPWNNIFEDINQVILPGVTHWQSPQMHGYFPALTSYPSMLAEMLTNAINCLGFTWASSPACTELEMIVMNWLGKMIGLPDIFLHKKSGIGGGVIQTTASESTLVSLLAGRGRAIKRYKSINEQTLENSDINAKLVAYCSDQAHSSVEKAALIGIVRLRYVESDDHYAMCHRKLLQQIQSDRDKGLVPFWVCATLGSTGSCSFDNLEEISRICKQEDMWLHVDAAYAGSAFICPEYRHWLKGIEDVDSIAFNPSKWLMVHFDCTAMWVKDSSALHEAFNVDPVYLQHEYSGLAIDFMHWQIPLSKRFRALKLWSVIRSYGIRGLQKHIRHGVHLAERFEQLVREDERFEVPAKRHLGLVVFRLIGENITTESLWKEVNRRGNIHCVPAVLKGKYVIRFTVTSPQTTEHDIRNDWREIWSVANRILKSSTTYVSGEASERVKMRLGQTRAANENFGTSLLLSNLPHSPRIVNGSFAAICDHTETIHEQFQLFASQNSNQGSPAMRRRIKGIIMSGKQYSLDSHMDMVQGIGAPPSEYVLLEESGDDCDEHFNNSQGINASSVDNQPISTGTTSRHNRSSSMGSEHFKRTPFLMRMGSSKDICQECGHLNLSNN